MLQLLNVHRLLSLQSLSILHCSAGFRLQPGLFLWPSDHIGALEQQEDLTIAAGSRRLTFRPSERSTAQGLRHALDIGSRLPTRRFVRHHATAR